MKTEIYDIQGMHCAACSGAIERVTRRIPGVSQSDVNLPMNRLTITYDENQLNGEFICAKIKKAGFSASLHNQSEIKPQKEENTLKNEKINLIVSSVLCGILLYVSMGQMIFKNIPIPEIFSINAHPTNFAILQMMITVVVIFIERKFFKSGFTSLFHKNPNMDTLVAISSATSFAYSFVMTLLIDDNPHAVHNLYYESSAIVLTLVSVGKFLENQNKEKTKYAIEKLIKLTPETAILVDKNGQWEVPTNMIKVGDTVLVKAGESVPLDGVVLKGTGSINEAMLTGESLPVDKIENSTVMGGSICTSGVLYVKITKIGNDTTLAKIVKFIEEAQGKKAPISKLADKVASIFVPVVIVIALISSVIWLILGKDFSFALKIFTSVLVIACPCSLGLATPTSIIVGTGLGANHGILIRNAEVLENIHKAKVVIFDKTGTITNGTPKVTGVYCEDMDENEFLKSVISVEMLSSHPLAKAICQETTNRNLTVTAYDGSFENKDGLGIVCEDLIVGNEKLMENYEIEISNFAVNKLKEEGNTVVYVAKNQKLLGYISINDSIKSTAKQTIEKLKTMNIKSIMLTGDNIKTANAIAKQVEIDQVIAEVLPTQKADIVKKYQNDGNIVMMVGDGINDAPALVQADVGCAVGNGSDIAIDSAKVILMKEDLQDVVKTINLSKATIKNIKENLFWAFCYNCICIPIAAGVLFLPFNILLTPMIGGLAMSLSSIFVVTNALRLRKAKI